MNIAACHWIIKKATSYLLFAVTTVCFFLSAFNVKGQTGDITVKNGDIVTVPDFPLTTCVFRWSNNSPGIGLAAKGAGNIGSFIAKNETSAPIVARISVTPIPQPPPNYVAAGPYTSVQDALTNQETGRINIPFGMLRAKSKDGTIGYFMSNNDIHTLYKVNLLTNDIISSTNIPTGIYAVQLSPDDSKVYVSSRSTLTQPNSITVLNAATNAIESVINLPANAYYDGGLITADGTRMILYDQSRNKVMIVNLATKSIAFEITVNKPQGAKLSLDGSVVYITSVTSNILTVIDTRTGGVRTVALNSQIYSLLMSADGSKMYFTSGTSGGAGSVDVLDTETLTISTIPTGVFGNLYLSPDNKTLYIFQTSYAGAEVGVLNLTTGKLIATVPVNTQPSDSDFNFYLKYASLVVSIDGQYVYTSLTTSNYQYNLLYTYVKVISTKSNLVVDSIPNGTIPPQFPPGTCSAPFTFKITVNPPPPAIFSAGTLSALKTTYGTPSTPSSFTVSGTNIAKGIMVTPPKGFEVSTDGRNYADNILVGVEGTVLSTQVYVRLKATAPVGTVTTPGNIVLTSGPTTQTIATASTEVTGVPLTITANTTSKTYGASFVVVPGSTDFTAQGLQNGETIGSVTLTYTTGGEATAVTGTYPNSVTPSAPIGGTFLAGNYVIGAPQKGDLVVVPAPLTVTAEDKSRPFGAANPALTIKYSGFVNNEDISQLTSTPVASTTADRASLKGQYPITVTGAAAANYTLVYVQGTLTVLEQLIIPTNAFTPNGDGVNDTWDIQNIAQYPTCTVEIFSRYGEKIFHSMGYPSPWNGRYKGTNLPVGTYYYIIKLNSSIKPVTGNLTIIR